MNITAKASSGKYKDLPEGDNTEYLDKADQSGFLIFEQNKPRIRTNLFDASGLDNSDYRSKACKRTSQDNLTPHWKRGATITASEEILLTLRARAGDQKARNRLIESHWFLCGKLAAKYRRKLPFDDAMSEAMAALILAVDRFDPANGRLKTYAWQWMRGAILKAELANYSIGPLGGTKQQHLFFNLNKEKAKRGISFVGGEGEAASIGRTLSTDRFNLTAKDVLLAEARVAHGGDLSLDAVIYTDDDGNDITSHDFFADDGPGPEATLINAEEREALAFALDTLDERELRIFDARVLAEEPPTLELLANEFDLSSERIRQIELAAGTKVKAAVLEYLARNRIDRLASNPDAATVNDGLTPWRRYRMLIDKNFSPEMAEYHANVPRVRQKPQDRPQKTVLQAIEDDARHHRKNAHVARIEALKVVDVLTRSAA